MVTKAKLEEQLKETRTDLAHYEKQHVSLSREIGGLTSANEKLQKSLNNIEQIAEDRINKILALEHKVKHYPDKIEEYKKTVQSLSFDIDNLLSALQIVVKRRLYDNDEL